MAALIPVLVIADELTLVVLSNVAREAREALEAARPDVQGGIEYLTADALASSVANGWLLSAK